MKFGQYELLEPIAMGGMAEVFKGRVVAAEGFEKHVAIKRILPDLAEDERFVKMLLTEARIHSALSHRNIVQIHDLGISEDGEYFIVLEYVEGYDLRVITEQLATAGEIVPEALSLYIAAEIAEGLHYAHEMRSEDGQPLGLIHRDVTPSNILISFAGEVKLSDFGLAKRRHDRSVVGSLKGNLAYMSPEQAVQAELDRRTDIFSLGAVLFQLMTGRRLREITDEVAGWNQVASGVIPSARRIRPDLPVPIERLLDRALAAEPKRRFPDAAAFGSAVRDVLTQLNIPVGASDLSALLGMLTPPRRARSLMMERSKVIRLGNEAKALREAIAAPATPGPVVAPGMTPVSLTALERASASDPYTDPEVTPQPVARVRKTTPPPPGTDPMATPPPSAPLPPARARGFTPHRPDLATPPPPARARGFTPHRPGLATPPPPLSSQPRAPAVDRRAAPTARLKPMGPASDRPDAHRTTNPGLSPADRVGERGLRPREPIAGGAGPSQGPGNNINPRTVTNPPYGRPGQARGPLYQTPSYGVSRPAVPSLGPGANSPPQGVPKRAPTFQSRPHYDTERIRVSSSGGWGTFLLGLIVLVAGAVAIVHFYFVPLDVLITWRKQASLAIASEPSGAKVRLDGVELGGTTPLALPVWRDRADHVIEVSQPGYREARETIRLDKVVSPTFLLRQQKEVTPVLQAMPPSTTPAPASPDAGTAP